MCVSVRDGGNGLLYGSWGCGGMPADVKSNGLLYPIALNETNKLTMGGCAKC